MKKIFFLLFLFLLFYTSFAQNNSGRGFSYQALARDANGEVRTKQDIKLKFSFLYIATAGNADYVEEHTTKTDAFGVFSVVLGGTNNATRTSATGNFNTLDFRSTNYWLKIQIWDNNAWQDVTTQALLSVPYAEYATTASNGVPIGTIVPYAGNFTETLKNQGWLFCDGSPVSKTDYLDLWNAIGEIWGYGNDGTGGTIFSLPDLQGQFLRGVDVAGNNDPDKSTRTLKSGISSGTVGSYQPDAFQGHWHTTKRTSSAGDCSNCSG